MRNYSTCAGTAIFYNEFSLFSNIHTGPGVRMCLRDQLPNITERSNKSYIDVRAWESRNYINRVIWEEFLARDRAREEAVARSFKRAAIAAVIVVAIVIMSGLVLLYVYLPLESVILLTPAILVLAIAIIQLIMRVL